MQNVFTKNLLSNVIAGLICGAYVVMTCLSFSALFSFSGASNYFSEITGFYLLGTAILLIVSALFSSVPIAIASPTNTSSSILLLIIMHIIMAVEAHGVAAQIYPTLFAGFIVSGIFTGVVFLFIGYLRQANLIRHIPKYISSAFMASIGWIIVQKAVFTLTNNMELKSLPLLFAALLLALLQPAQPH